MVPARGCFKAGLLRGHAAHLGQAQRDVPASELGRRGGEGLGLRHLLEALQHAAGPGGDQPADDDVLLETL